MDEDAWLTRKRLIMSHITSKGQAERYLQVWYCRQLPSAAEARLKAQSCVQLAAAVERLCRSVKTSMAAVLLHRQCSTAGIGWAHSADAGRSGLRWLSILYARRLSQVRPYGGHATSIHYVN